MLTKEERIQLRDEIFKEFKERTIIYYKEKYNYYQFTNPKKMKEIILPNNSQLQEKYNLYIEQFKSEEEAMYCILHLEDYTEHLCLICNDYCDYYKKNRRYKITCGRVECREKLANSDEAKKKGIQTNFKKYGVKNAMQSKEIQEKSKRTNLERRGVEYPMQSKEVQEKSKKTVRERYGVENVFQSKEIQEKSKKTCLEKYGVEYSSQSEQVKEKIKKTNLEKYGVEHALQNINICNKMKQTNLEKYGYENVFQCKQIQEKSKQTNLKKYNVKYNMQCEEIRKKAIANIRKTFIEKNTFNNPIKQDEIINFIKEFKEKYNINELSDIYSNDNYFIKFIEIISAQKNRLLRLYEISNIFNVIPQTIKKRCEELNILNYFFIKDSNLELKIKELLDNNNIQYKRYNKSILYPQEIDFLIDDIGIEINDIDSHNIKKKNINYHYNKTLKAKEYNIRLIHIWEWELTDKILWERLSRWIINLLNDNKVRIGARKCLIKKISEDIEKEFLNNYHLQGYKKSEVCYGLYNNNELIQIMSFTKPRYNKNYQWELLRFCTKYGYNVIGGAQKLLKNFIRNNNPKSIISYCYLDKFTGNIYEQLGFKLLKRNQPSATWYNQEIEKHFNQSSLNMIGADKLLGTNYGKGTNNEEIAYKSGYQKIYNCGINVYVLEY